MIKFNFRKPMEPLKDLEKPEDDLPSDPDLLRLMQASKWEAIYKFGPLMIIVGAIMIIYGILGLLFK